MKRICAIGILILAVSCNSPQKETKTALAPDSSKQVEYFDRGMIADKDTSSLKAIPDTSFNLQASDNSRYSLRQDNYFVDQFSCVVEGFGYYRLTNTHPTSRITGCVTKSWPYNGAIVYAHESFTLLPKQWKTFGCFFVSRTQPITFEICSRFGTAQECACQ